MIYQSHNESKKDKKSNVDFEMNKLASPIFQSISSGEHNKITSKALSNPSISKYIASTDLANSDSRSRRYRQ